MDYKWVIPCSECGFAEYGANGNIIGPVWERKGTKCPECKVKMKIVIVGEGGPNSHAEIREDRSKDV